MATPRTWIPSLALLLGSCSVPPSSFGELREREHEPGYAEIVEAELDALGHVGDPKALQWTNLDAEIGLSCVDGRAEEGVVGSPGGDAGELLLLLAAAEGQGQAIDAEQVPALISDWIAEFGGFYMHTDVEALAALGRSLAADPRFEAELAEFVDESGELDLVDLEAWLRSPPEAIHEPLLAHLVDPDAVGCGHLRSMLRAPDDYAVRPALAGAVIVGFYRRLWTNPEQVRFVVLRGEHHERAILDLEVEPSLVHEVPLIVPSNAHDQVFVIQPQAVAVLRTRAAKLLHRRQPNLDLAALEAGMHALGDQQLAATIRHLDVHVPIVRVVVDHVSTRSIAALSLHGE